MKKRDQKMIQESIYCWQEQGFLAGIGKIAGGTEKLMSGLMTISLLTSQAKQLAGMFFQKTKNRCDGVKGLEHEECITKTKIEAMKELIRKLSGSREKCNQTKDSRACMEAINNKISEAREQLRRYEEALRGE